NPPYFDRATGTRARAEDRETALGGQAGLDLWLSEAAKRLVPKGYLHVILRAERLPELLSHAVPRLGSLQLLPLIPRPGRDSQLILLRARKGGRTAFRLHAGLVMHEGTAHAGDREHYTAQINAVLREAAALPFPD
ncbi:MAG: methyltransferase, partial [Paracoccaceae bacterium]